MWVEKNASRYRISEIARGMAIYDEVKPASRSDGQPINGWDTFFDDALAGRLTAGKKVGDQAKAEAVERGQLPPATRRRLKS